MGKKEEIDDIQFPEFIFKDMGLEQRQFLKRNWSGDPEKFVENCTKEMGIKVECDPDDPEWPSVKISKR